MDSVEAYRICRQSAHSHYENFPVASLMLPRSMRGPVAAIYWFARTADDHADEGGHTPAERLAALATVERELTATYAGTPPDSALWHALADTMQRFDLTEEHFLALLSAFRQDVTCSRYADFEEVLDYCERSANPVGRLLLQLARESTAANLRAADSVCTALQLINFLQDLHQDFVERDRLYIPQRDLFRHGVTEAELRSGRATPGVMTLLGEQIERAAWWLYQGAELGDRLRGRFGMEIRLIIRGGWRTIEHLRREKLTDPLARPRLDRQDHRWILRGLISRRTLPRSITPPADPVRTRLYAIDSAGNVQG